MKSSLLILFALCFFSGVFFVVADDYPVDLTNDQQPPNYYPHPDVSITSVFPSSADLKFTSGEIVDFLVGFTNENAGKRFNITRVFGFLSHPQEPTHIMQNFTQILYHSISFPQSTNTLLYRFYPDPNLESRDYSFSAIINYHDGPTQYFNYVYNGTIFLENAPEDFDGSSVLTLLILAALIGFPFYLYSPSTITKPFKKFTSPKASPASPNTSGAIDRSLLPQHVLDHEKKSKVRTPKRK